MARFDEILNRRTSPSEIYLDPWRPLLQSLSLGCQSRWKGCPWRRTWQAGQARGFLLPVPLLRGEAQGEVFRLPNRVRLVRDAGHVTAER